MKTLFYWRDEPIEDIEKWAADRGERMVDVVWKKKDVNPYARTITYYEEKDAMPESFFGSMRMTEDSGYIIRHKYRKPKVESKSH